MRTEKEILDGRRLTKEFLKKCKLKPHFFIRRVIGLKPTWYQAEFIKTAQDHDKLAYVLPRQHGKTEAVICLTLWYAYTHPNKTCMVISRALRQATDVLKRMKNWIRNNELLRTVKHSGLTWSKTEIEFPNGSRILCMPPSRQTILGIPADWIVVDEAAHFPNDEVYYEAISPMATPGTKLILISTPYGQRGFFYKCFHSEGFHSILHKAVEDGKPIWAEKRPLQWLKGKKKEIGKRAFNQEYMCDWLSVKDAYFSYDTIMKAVKNFDKLNYELKDPKGIWHGWRPPRGEYYAGVDWAKSLHTGDKTVIYVVEKLPNDHLKVNMIKVYDPRQKESVEFLYNEACDFIVQAHRVFDFKKVYADMGAGAKQVEDLKLAGVPVEGIAFGSAGSFDTRLQKRKSKKIDMMSFLYHYLENETIYLPDKGDMLRELFEFEIKTVTEGGKPRSSPKLAHPPGGHDDHVDALAMAVYATRRIQPSYAIGGFSR